MLRSYKSFILIVMLFIVTPNIHGQLARLDWKLHDIGAVRQVVTNMGTNWGTFSMDYPYLLYCEYPLNSNEEHIGEGGLWIGALSDKDTLVSATSIWADPHHEFYPTESLWDTVWIAEKGDTVDIPYWPGYTPVSDQDLVCRYADYNPASLRLGDHSPLYLDVIQVSYAWSSAPLNEMIVYTFHITPTRNNLQDVYLGYWMDANIGDRPMSGYAFGTDDASLYREDRHLAISYDLPGNTDGTAVSPIGIQVFPPKELDNPNTQWTFIFYGQGQAPSDDDNDLYMEMSSGRIMEDQQPSGGQSHTAYQIALGKINQLSVGDTVTMVVGQIMGEGIEGVEKNSEVLSWLIEQDFKVPSPPPNPPLRVETQSHRAILTWQAGQDDVDPETYFDENRADSITQPFEGYRVYKSTKSSSGPWTLLAEYDIDDNEFGLNTGLNHRYEDVGLLDNLEYYYSVTAYSKPDTVSDFPSQESSINANSIEVVPGPAPPKKVGKVRVVPNPYRGDIAYHEYDPPWEKVPGGRNWMEQDRRIQFINLPQFCEIKVYTLAGELVETLTHRSSARGTEDWNLTSSVGQAVASGIYLFTVEDLNSGDVQTGKFVIIK
ncbi:MAG: hypothetical protein GF313_16030 [Caldithrix sp.]|nr:hypothetical protein [Caldithrix sp.]